MLQVRGDGGLDHGSGNGYSKKNIQWIYFESGANKFY